MFEPVLIGVGGAMLVLLMLALAIWLKVASLPSAERFDALLERIEHGESEAREQRFAQEHALGDVSRQMGSELSATRELLELRLASLKIAELESAATLREQLMDRLEHGHHLLLSKLGDADTRALQAMHELREQVAASLSNHHARLEQRHTEALHALQTSMASGFESAHKQLGVSLEQSRSELGERMERLTRSTDERLREISEQVEKRLADGFEKTTATFTDVVKRLALIDDAQKKITELSGNVVSLQQVLADKRSRGAFGEVQLNALVRNVMPESGFALQHTLSNGRIADCMLFLPAPTGNVAIDSKFPLESYQRMVTPDISEHERTSAERRFKSDIRKHIHDIASRYVLPGETAEGAVMFLPAEAVFAEIQAHHPELVQLAYDQRVWIASPTTLMAILNTARAVLKDEATRAQVHIIRDHLGALAKDFERFQQRMDNLARHIKQAGRDVDEVHVSARKISARFGRIDRVELDEAALDTTSDDDPQGEIGTPAATAGNGQPVAVAAPRALP